MAPVATSSRTASNGHAKAKPEYVYQEDKQIGFPSVALPEFKDKHEERDWVKGRLAAAYRMFGHYDLNEGFAGHITARDPIDTHTFWVNPFGIDFNLINKSDLLRVDHKGNVLDHGPRSKILNRAAFIIHAAIHEARPDVFCAAHTHSINGRAFCSLGIPLDPISLESQFFYEDHVVYEGKGVAVAEEEGVDIAEVLGSKKAALLRNHGILTVGSTIEEAVGWFYILDKCCKVQLIADAAAQGRGNSTVKVSHEEGELVEEYIVNSGKADRPTHLAQYTRKMAGTPKAGHLAGQMMLELIDDRTNKTYLK